MSLKYFHLVFISAATLACFAFAAYASFGISGAVKDQLTVAGRLSALLGAILAIYGVVWMKKLRTLDA
jgi:hypothetical protein